MFIIILKNMWDRKIDRKSERKVRGIIVIMNKIIFELKILDKICKRYKYKNINILIMNNFRCSIWYIILL